MNLSVERRNSSSADASIPVSAERTPAGSTAVSAGRGARQSPAASHLSSPSVLRSRSPAADWSGRSRPSVAAQVRSSLLLTTARRQARPGAGRDAVDADDLTAGERLANRAAAACLGVGPATSRCGRPGAGSGPVVERGGVEIRSVRPDRRVGFRVDPDSFERRDVTKGAVDSASCAVVEPDVQHERTDDGERRDAAERAVHPVFAHCDGSFLSGERPAWRSRQSVASSA